MSPEPQQTPLRRLLQLTWRYRSACVGMFALQVLLLGLSLGGLSLSGLCIDVLREALDPSAPAAVWPAGLEPPGTVRQSLLWIGAGVLICGALHALLSHVYALLSGRVLHLQLVPELRSRVFARLLRLSQRFHRDSGSASLINRVTSDVQAARSFVDGVLLQGGILIFTLVVYAAFMLRAHVVLTVACLVATPLIWLLTRRFSAWARPAYGRSRELSDRMVLAMSEGIAGVQVTKVFGREPEEQRRFEGHNEAIVEQQESIFRAASYFTAAVHFASHVNLAVLLGYGGFLVVRNALTLGDLVVFARLLSHFSQQVSAMARVVNTLSQSLAGARRVFEVLDAPTETPVVDPGASPGEPEALRLCGDLRFEGVSVQYPGGAGEAPALRDVSFEVPAGTTVGIVGATGAGKSTLIALLSRFVEPSRGRVLIDGRDLCQLPLEALRRQVGMVLQSTLLFRRSIADNVAFGVPTADRAAIEHAIGVASAEDLVRELPGGLDAMLAEEAGDLSGGQRQRLALARAVLVDPPILVLDDPTSALDSQTESRVLERLRAVMRGRTTLLVASRVSTLRHADRILVLDGGRLVEQGTHEELVRRDGHYRQIAELQGVVEASPAPSPPVSVAPPRGAEGLA